MLYVTKYTVIDQSQSIILNNQQIQTNIYLSVRVFKRTNQQDSHYKYSLFLDAKTSTCMHLSINTCLLSNRADMLIQFWHTHKQTNKNIYKW